MRRSRSQSSKVPYPKVWLIVSIAVLGLVLVSALIPPDVVWATPPYQDGTVPPVVGRTRPPGIPEPATIGLVGLGVGALFGYARHRRRANEKKLEE